MTAPTRTYRGFRMVETLHGDTLRHVSARELGDAERWYELIPINSLLPPYLTDDPAEVKVGVLLTGSRLLVPASASYIPAAVDPESVFGSDIKLTRGELTAVNGDIVVTAGTANLVQAIRHVIATDLGELIHHQRYGCGAHQFIGQRNTPQIQLIVDGLVRRAVASDARISEIRSSRTSVEGDQINVEMVAMAVNGVSVDVVPN